VEKAEDDSIKLQEITNTMDDTEPNMSNDHKEDENIKIIPRDETILEPLSKRADPLPQSSPND
jgi:hypothetical protein